MNKGVAIMDLPITTSDKQDALGDKDRNAILYSELPYVAP